MTFRKRFGCGKRWRGRGFAPRRSAFTSWSSTAGRWGKDYFAPGLTSYEHTLQYQTYDVTELLGGRTHAGRGGRRLGGGGLHHEPGEPHHRPRQALLAELRIAYEDGTEGGFGTDESWEVTEEGRYRYGDFYDGEVYDAAADLEKADWRQAGRETVRIQPELVATYGNLVRAHEVMRPVSCVRGRSGMLIYDFGQNFAGVISAKLRGRPGRWSNSSTRSC